MQKKLSLRYNLFKYININSIMPLTKKGKSIYAAMLKEYGARKGRAIFYATENKYGRKWHLKKKEGKNDKKKNI